MKKIISLLLLGFLLIGGIYYAFIYFVSFSEGVRSGELIKLTHKGVIAKTWEAEISQGISGAQIFAFSVLDKDKDVIEKLKEYQGQYVKVNYTERYATFFWLGDTKYFITAVKAEKSPHFRN